MSLLSLKIAWGGHLKPNRLVCIIISSKPLPNNASYFMVFQEDNYSSEMHRDTPMQESKVFQNCWPRLHLAQVHFDESAAYATACTLLCDALGLWYFLCSKKFFLCFKGPCF